MERRETQPKSGPEPEGPRPAAAAVEPAAAEPLCADLCPSLECCGGEAADYLDWVMCRRRGRDA